LFRKPLISARDDVHLIALNNRDNTREALRNGDALIREGVLLPLELPFAVTEGVRAEVPPVAKANILHLDARGDVDQIPLDNRDKAAHRI